MLPSLSHTTSGSTRRTVVVFAALAVAILALPTLWWRAESIGSDAAVDVEYLPRPSKFEEQVLAALEKPTSIGDATDVDFVDLALEECVTYLSEAAKIPMWLDKQKLAEEGVALDQPMTLKMKDARLESVLNLLLRPTSLAFYPEDDVLIITTSTKAAENLITRTYPVRDLYQGRGQADVGIRRQRGGGSGGGGGGFFALQAAGGENELTQKSDKAAGGVANGPPLPATGAGDAAKVREKGAAPNPPQPEPRLKFTDLEDAITNTIQPDSWEEQDGPGTYTYVKETGCLVIRQTWAVHRQIVQLLRDLREAKHLAPGGKAQSPATGVKK